MYSAGPLRTTEKVNRYIFVVVKHLTGWLIARAIEDANVDAVICFAAREIVHSFGSSRFIVSYNANFYTAGSSKSFTEANSVAKKTVKAFSPMSNGRSDRLIGMIKRSVKEDDACEHRILG